MACSDCKRTADPADVAPIPLYAYEAAQAASERHIKRLIIALVIAVLLVFASNGIWLLAWVSYDYSGEETVVTQDGEGLNIYGDRNTTDFYGTDNPG